MICYAQIMHLLLYCYAYFVYSFFFLKISLASSSRIFVRAS